MKFEVSEFIRDSKYTDVGNDYIRIEVEKKYTVSTWDDLQNLLMTIIDFSNGSVKFEVRKEAADE